jgi:hypothetical protein
LFVFIYFSLATTLPSPLQVSGNKPLHYPLSSIQYDAAKRRKEEIGEGKKVLKI